MANVFESITLKGLRKTHIEQLMSYIDERDRSEWYYGNKEQFEKRHQDLKTWIEAACNYAYSNDVVLPKKG